MNHRLPFLSRQHRFVDLRSTTLIRLVLLLLLLLSFARVMWRLDANNLWWDESLSLQRAESNWGMLLRGEIVLSDGDFDLPTIDQHPFGFFVLLGALIRLAGNDEFVLRLPAAMGATLLVPIIWAIARLGIRRSILPPGTALAAAVLAALNPFFLYYGQEARSYTLLPVLALATVYFLLRWNEAKSVHKRRWFLVGYGITTLLFLSTHYFAVLLLPIHSILFLQFLMRRNPKVAWGIAAGLLLLALLVGLAASWIILSQPHSGRNFQPISLAILVPDLLNGFSLGLSVDIADVWWLDLVFGATALVGAVWVVHRRAIFFQGGWLWPTGILIPVLLLLIVNQFQPMYMNARHLGLIAGFYLLLLAAGVALLGRWYRPAAAGMLGLLLAGMVYSTFNYFTQPAYGKDNFAEVGAYLRRELAPGDLLLLNPPEMLRLYRYYLPVDVIENAALQGAAVTWQGVPLFAPADTGMKLASLLPQYRRVWAVTSGMVPFGDPQRSVQAWLAGNAFQIRDVNFFSTQSFLELDLYLPSYPQISTLPDDVVPVDADFAGRIRVLGYQIGRPLHLGSVTPVTIYWQALQPLDVRYKYLLYLEATNPDGSTQRFPVTEREPYDGFLPTTQWQPETIWVEHSDVFLPSLEGDASEHLDIKLVLQIYDATSLDTLPIDRSMHAEIGAEGNRLLFDFPVPRPDLQ